MVALRRFENRVAVVIGGGGGMGKATALRLSAEGAKVVVADTNAPTIDATVAEVSALGGMAKGAVLDATQEKEVAAAFKTIADEYGQLDVMVYSAGIKSKPVPAVDFDLTEWNRIFGVNLTGAMFCAREAGRAMGQSGSMVIISSINAFRMVPGALAYNSSKAAVLGLTQTFAIELAHKGVRVNAIAPGQIDTPKVQGEALRPENRQVRESGIPMRRFGRTDEIAAAVAFLASDDASYITGHTLIVDGGRLVLQHRVGFPIEG
jgi:NAD(P)-dependent dehydrogenase (short-subunit alcohol dehydrogenase family)